MQFAFKCYPVTYHEPFPALSMPDCIPKGGGGALHGNEAEFGSDENEKRRQPDKNREDLLEMLTELGECRIGNHAGYSSARQKLSAKACGPGTL